MRNKLVIITTGVIIGILAYWTPSNSPFEVLGMNLYLFLSLTTAILSFALNYFMDLSARVFSYPITLSIVAVHLSKIGYDLLFHVAKHKFLLLEVVMNGGIVIFCAFIGSMLVSFVKDEE